MFNLSHYLKSKSIKIYIFCCLFIIFLYLLTENTNISMYELVADPNEVGQVAAYVGLVSTIGILIFAATATACFFSAYILGQIDRVAKKWQSFLKISGFFIFLLLADDLWQLHESLPNLLFGNLSRSRTVQDIGEVIAFCFYGLLFVLYVLKFKKFFYQTRLTSLIAAVLFFCSSTIVDIWLANISGHFALEEGLKLLGIVSLAMYYFEVCESKIEQFLDARNKKNF